MTKVMSAFDNAMIKAQCTAMDEASKMNVLVNKIRQASLRELLLQQWLVWLCYLLVYLQMEAQLKDK